MRVKNYKAEKSNSIPYDALEALARCLYPAIVSYFESDEGQREFDEWKMKSEASEAQSEKRNAKTTSA